MEAHREVSGEGTAVIIGAMIEIHIYRFVNFCVADSPHETRLVHVWVRLPSLSDKSDQVGRLKSGSIVDKVAESKGHQVVMFRFSRLLIGTLGCSSLVPINGLFSNSCCSAGGSFLMEVNESISQPRSLCGHDSAPYHLLSKLQ
jgi:hypothetical protein